MTDTQSTDLLDALVVEVIRAEEAGEYVDRDAMLADHPECAEELRQFFADREQLRRFVKAEAPKLKPGTQIGRYKLLQQIGEGGFGAVYMAEQTSPVQRHVALKIIKPGMDSRQVIARFEAERQALALMDHMNLAKVLDAGTSDGGRPFFVMELVKGVPITRYCDKNRLTIRERLELFVPVC